MSAADQFRALPSVDEVLGKLEHLARVYPRPLVVNEIRRVLEQARSEIRAGQVAGEAVEVRVERSLAALAEPSLERVINATGVVLHTNLGRAPLVSFAPISGYSNLEYVRSETAPRNNTVSIPSRKTSRKTNAKRPAAAPRGARAEKRES